MSYGDADRDPRLLREHFDQDTLEGRIVLNLLDRIDRLERQKDNGTRKINDLERALGAEELKLYRVRSEEDGRVLLAPVLRYAPPEWRDTKRKAATIPRPAEGEEDARYY